MAVSARALRGRPMATLRTDPASPWRHLDLGLLGATLAVAGLGTIMVFSASRYGLAEEGLDSSRFLLRQLLYLGLGAAAVVVVSLLDYGRYRELAPVIYVGAIGLLVGVLSPLGTEVNGSQSWYGFGAFQLQPAELAKLGVIVMLAAYCSAHRGELDGLRLVVSLAIAGIPAGLIFLQPDVGSMLVFVALTMGVLLVAGARTRHVVGITLVGIGAVVYVFAFTGLIEGYQRDRLTAAYASEEVDGRGIGFNLEQAKTAIGNGGLTGRGLFEGTQTRTGLVPEQQTDFIFTVVGEELGFLGGTTLLVLYGFMAWRIWRAASVSRDLFGTLLCVGVLSMLVFQIFENIGMTMGITPITGIPLPFMSYGGSSTITNFAAVGLVLNVSARRYT